jgi:hypothetical protein
VDDIAPDEYLKALAIDQDALGRAARPMSGPPVAAEIWFKDLADGSHAVGFFNRTDQIARVDTAWRNFGFGVLPEVRDVWAHRNLGLQARYSGELRPHGCALLRVKGPLGTEGAQQ